MPRASRSSRTARIVRRVRRAITLSGTRPSCRISSAFHGAAFLSGFTRDHERIAVWVSQGEIVMKTLNDRRREVFSMLALHRWTNPVRCPAKSQKFFSKRIVICPATDKVCPPIEVEMTNVHLHRSRSFRDRWSRGPALNHHQSNPVTPNETEFKQSRIQHPKSQRVTASPG